MSTTNGHPAPGAAPGGSPGVDSDAASEAGSGGLSPAMPPILGGGAGLAGQAQAADVTALSTLRTGQAGVVQRMEEVDHAMLIRLKTMGLVPGVAVRVVRGGSRMIVAANGVRIGLAKVVARHVGVSMIPVGSPGAEGASS